MKALLLILAFILMPLAGSARGISLDRLTSYPTDRLMSMGGKYMGKANHEDSALICYNIIAGRYSGKLSKREKRQCAEACMQLWNLYFSHYYDYSRAYESLTHGIAIRRALGEESAYDYLLLGGFYETLYSSTRDSLLGNKGLEYMHKSFAMAKKGRDIQVTNMAFSNLVLLADETGKLSSVGKEWEAYKSIHVDDNIYDYNKLLYLGLKDKAEGNARASVEKFRRQQRILGNDPDKSRYLFMSYYNEADALFASGQTAEAIARMKTAEGLSKRIGAKDAAIAAYDRLADYYKALPDGELAQHYRILYYQLNDSLLGYRQMNQINEMKYIGQIRESNERLMLAEQQHRFDVLLVVALMSIAAIVIVFLLMLYHKNKRLTQKNKLLYDKNEELILGNERESDLRRQNALLLEQEKYKSSTLADDEKSIIADRVESIMQNNPEIYSPDFTVGRLSELVGYPKRDVSQAINEKLGVNFRQYLNRYRINEACRMLKSASASSLTFEAMGERIGFKSRTSFIASFKKVTGLTPSEYVAISRE